ncbi:MAG TPA: UDP-N-acetylmuramate dehydrogenase [Bacteroidales bacterium]|nr:UDP-N-acetylmuramate dehydrogenase [Bacteroidales bacterium]
MIYESISLKKYNTFGLNIKADHLITFKQEENAIRFFRTHKDTEENFLILGGGSNLLFLDDFHGTVIHPEMEGVFVEEKKEDYVIISSGSGIVWDKLVEQTVNYGFGGLENLSLIPGLVGATPVQNIGAYGSEVKDTIEKVRTICLQDGSVKEFTNVECRFGYRDSAFKHELKGKYLITRVYYKLTTRPKLSLEYGSLKEEMNKLGASSLINVRNVVISARQCKLPDTKLIGNAGSFFKNPVVGKSVAEDLKKKYHRLPAFEDPYGNIKLTAAWLIEQCGWKGKRKGDAGVSEKQSLVIVNYGNATGREIYDLSEDVRKSVFEEFGITLEREVEVIGIT